MVMIGNAIHIGMDSGGSGARRGLHVRSGRPTVVGAGTVLVRGVLDVTTGLPFIEATPPLELVSGLPTVSGTGLVQVASVMDLASAISTVVGAGTVTGGAFSPLDIEGAVAWIDMQDSGAYTESGGLVTQVINKVSAVAWTEATTRPAFSATALNGLPCMDFDGTNDKIMSTEAAVVAVFSGGGVPYELFIVGQLAVADSIERLFGVGDSGTTDGHRSWGATTTGSGLWTAAATSDAGAAANAASAGGSDTNPHILNWWAEDVSGFKTSLSIDGGAADPNAAAQVPGTITPDRVALGCRPSGTIGSFFGGNGGEWIVYDRALTSLERADVLAYLQTKWSL